MTGDVLGPSQAVVAAQQRAERAYRLARAWLSGLVALLVVVVIALLVAVTLQTRGIASSVESCITPGGDCYERSIVGQQQRLENLEQAESNGEHLERVLAILRVQFPEAYEAVTNPAP